MARLHLIIGPVGAGKSTYARKLCREQNAARLVLDEWMATLYGDDPRPNHGRLQWYMERAERCLEQIWCVAQDLMDIGTPVVLEVGLIQRARRQDFYARVDNKAYDLSVYVLDADRDVRRARVERRNRDKGETFSMEVPPDMFELASDLWEPPADDECAEREVHFIRQTHSE
ncbi:MAG: ATP-binding protein [Proteobacteria bacterium]|nr:ATP-binding protein [Pseudomonadota bacterium]